MTYQGLIDSINRGDMSARTAKLLAADLPDFNDAMIDGISAAHEAKMKDVCDHQDNMDRVMRRGVLK